jgi:hypothetical protein
MIFSTVLEARPDLLQDVANEKPRNYPEIVVLLELSRKLLVCYIFLNFLIDNE